MKTLVVDDDSTARRIVEGFVTKTDGLTLQGSFGSAVDAKGYLAQNDVDLIFLDVEMPEMTGLELLENTNANFDVIFITAKEEYAAEAFDKSAVDYLVKPVSYGRFTAACDKIKSRSRQSEGKGFIFVKHGSVLVKLMIDNIDYIESIGDYIGVHVDQKRYVVHTTMKEAESKLPSGDFCRIHRSYIVNFSRIDQIEENTVLLAGNSLPISRTYKKDLIGRLNTL